MNQALYISATFAVDVVVRFVVMLTSLHGLGVDSVPGVALVIVL